jgi:hypothetical protein
MRVDNPAHLGGETMKTLHLRRHSTKDGSQNTIGEKGLKLASIEGERADTTVYTRVFHGPLVRTAQTALAFINGLNYGLAPMPVVFGLGSDALFAEMANEAWKVAVKGGARNFEALLVAHPINQVKIWAMDAKAAVEQMFAAMEDDETAIGFFHSPTIELAVWAILEYPETLDEYSTLGDLEGVEVFFDFNDELVVGLKLSVTPPTA